MARPMFSPEELEELRRFDEELDKEYVQTQEEIVQSRKRDRAAAVANMEPEKRKIAEYQAAYYEANKDKIAEYKAAYREANKDKIAEYQAAYYEANKDKIAEYKAAYREANKDKIAEYQAAYREKHREELNTKARESMRRLRERRKAEKLANAGETTPQSASLTATHQCVIATGDHGILIRCAEHSLTQGSLGAELKA